MKVLFVGGILALVSAMPILAQTTDPCTDPASGVVCQSTAAVVDAVGQAPSTVTWVRAALRVFGLMFSGIVFPELPKDLEPPLIVQAFRPEVVDIVDGWRPVKRPNRLEVFRIRGGRLV